MRFRASGAGESAGGCPPSHHPPGRLAADSRSHRASVPSGSTKVKLQPSIDTIDLDDVRNCRLVLVHIFDALETDWAAPWPVGRTTGPSEDAHTPTVINFGRHCGAKFSDLPANHRRWLLNQPDLDPFRHLRRGSRSLYISDGKAVATLSLATREEWTDKLRATRSSASSSTGYCCFARSLRPPASTCARAHSATSRAGYRPAIGTRTASRDTPTR